MSGKVLVTGGAGFLGSAIVKRLVAAGRDVRVFDDFSRGAPRRLERTDVETVSGDIRDAAAVERAMSGVSTAKASSASWVWGRLSAPRRR